MAKKAKSGVAKRAVAKHDAESVVAKLKSMASTKVRDGMARYGIPAHNALGIAVGDLKKLAKQLGRDHGLAEELWRTNIYEARMLATFIDDPEQVTAAQMDRWCRDFDSWAICDTACFALFDRAAHRWKKVDAWATRKQEFIKRAAFAMLASLTVHDKEAEDELFANGLTLVEQAAGDDRNFVKKAVNWALRSIGKRSARLHAAAVALASRLAESEDPAPRWIGKDALRELSSPAVTKRVASRGARE